ncbi:hypothetical protein [Streptomyces sp. FIT100]|uniref:non-homologous end-joining DNA ligase LigD n=1 Tax=Streptomyces sp. FIT100 TaxID=2837956 RepID=UPI0037D9C94B
MRKAARGDRFYLDAQRNGCAQTALAPFSVRTRDGAPVTTPLAWEQLPGRRRRTLGKVAERAGGQTVRSS